MASKTSPAYQAGEKEGGRVGRGPVWLVAIIFFVPGLIILAVAAMWSILLLTGVPVGEDVPREELGPIYTLVLCNLINAVAAIILAVGLVRKALKKKA